MYQSESAYAHNAKEKGQNVFVLLGFSGALLSPRRAGFRAYALFHRGRRRCGDICNMFIPMEEKLLV